MLKKLAASLGILSLALLSGCGDGVDTHPVSGTITLDGTPIQGASVTFQPVEGGTGMPAVGTTDANGKYQLTDMRSDDVGSGAEAGEYRVGVLWYKPTGEDTSSATGDSTGESVGDEQSRQGVTGPEALLPAKYQNPKTSELTTTVTAGKNTIDFELLSK